MIVIILLNEGYAGFGRTYVGPLEVVHPCFFAEATEEPLQGLSPDPNCQRKISRLTRGNYKKQKESQPPSRLSTYQSIAARNLVLCDLKSLPHALGLFRVHP